LKSPTATEDIAAPTFKVLKPIAVEIAMRRRNGGI
jgi:hypothetical protein